MKNTSFFFCPCFIGLHACDEGEFMVNAVVATVKGRTVKMNRSGLVVWISGRATIVR